MLRENKEKKIQQKIKEITGLKFDINRRVCYDLQNKAPYFKINKLIVLSSSFDYFLLEEEGRLENLFLDRCPYIEKESPPDIIHAESGKECINILANEKVDLIIIFNKPVDDTITSIAEKLRKQSDAPISVIANNIQDLEKIKKQITTIDGLFTWNGDGKIILTIVQHFEDMKNIEYFRKKDNRKYILLIEDAIQYYSKYLSLLNDEICNYLTKTIHDELSCEQKTLRYRRRPIVLHAKTIKEAEKFFNRFKENIICIITDNYLTKENNQKAEGIEFVQNILKLKINLPILIQSSEPFDEDREFDTNIQYISKKSSGLVKSIKKFTKEHLGPKDIILYNDKRKEVFKIKSINDCQYALLNFDSTILLKSAKKKEISRWLFSIGENELAEKCNLIEERCIKGNDLKKELLELIEDYEYSINQSSITDFSREVVDPYVKIRRIGNGALGGKARGIAFIAKILSKYLSKDIFPGLRITVPRSIVLSTDVFDAFLEHNKLSDLDFMHLSDDRIAAKFMNASLPATVLGDLRTFIRNTRKPLIVRSSGLLEDSLTQPFAGIYASVLLPNESWETDLRFQEVCNAIKYVFASTYFEKARTYVKSTPKSSSDEKMAILIQEVIGENHGSYFYPIVSGVAKSYNYYPSGPCKQEDGIVYLALGLGKAIVDGGASFAFCPERPQAPLFGTPKDYMKYAQTQFYALDLSSIYRFVDFTEETSLDRVDIDVAKKHGVLNKIVSTYVQEDDTLYPGIYDKGYLVLDFGPLLAFNDIQLPKAIKLLLQISEIALGYPVEIEFALKFSKDDTKPAELIILQIRNMIPPHKKIDIDIDKMQKKEFLICSENALGNGIFGDLRDIIYVNEKEFDMSKSRDVVNQLRKLNIDLMDKNKPYILIGPGRWGSTDPWLGIPVIWSDIAGAKIIIETPYKERHIDPSQGSHFFHDMIASEVGYLITKQQKNIDWHWIYSQEKVTETRFLTHIKSKNPLQGILDGKKGKAIIREVKSSKK